MFSKALYTKAFVGLLFANMFYWASSFIFLPVLPVHYHHLGMNDYEVGLAIGIFSIGSVLFRVMSGKAVDRYGSYPVIVVGIALSCGAIYSYSYDTTLASAMISRFLHGIGASVYASAGLTMATLIHEPDLTPEAVGLYTLFSMIGMGMATSGIMLVYNAGTFTAVVVTGVIATVLSVILFPRKPQLRVKPNQGTPLPLRSIISNPGVYISTISLFGANFCYGSVMAFLPLLMLSRGVTDYTGFYVAYAVAIILSRVWVGKLCERIEPGRMVFYLLLLLTGSMALLSQSTAPWALVMSGLVFGTGYGFAFPILVTMVTVTVEPINRGAAFGFFTMAVDIGVAVGAIGMGIVASHLGYEAIFIALGGYILAYALVYRTALYPKTRHCCPASRG
jgi:MFS family permease